MTKAYENIKLNALPKLHFRHKEEDPRCLYCGVFKERVGKEDDFVYDEVEYRLTVTNVQNYGFCSCVVLAKRGVKRK